MKQKFSLSQVLEGHTNEIRCLCPIPILPDSKYGLVSGSKDETARLWSFPSSSESSKWGINTIYEGHTRYVSAIAYRDADERFRQGLIYTGCLDGIIRAYEPQNSDPHHTLKGHNDAVSSIFVSANKTLLTASWDKSCKIWLNEKSVTTLNGHEGAVWSAIILPKVGVMVTGAADYTVRLWKGGICKKILNGIHTQAVRGLGVVSSNMFVSCSNDGQVALWLLDDSMGNDILEASVIHRYKDSGNIYSIAVFPQSLTQLGWVCSGENTGIKVFDKDGNLCEVIENPSDSVRSIAVLKNGDIAAGASNNNVYIYSLDKSQLTFSDKSSLKQPQYIPLKNIHNPKPIKPVAGHHLEVDKATLKNLDRNYSNEKSRTFEKVGVRMKAKRNGMSPTVGRLSSNNKETDINSFDSAKESHDGIDYDFVFPINIGEGLPSLKLPYNKNEDPHATAQQFIDKHGLSQGYLDEIADFIIINSSEIPELIPQEFSHGPSKMVSQNAITKRGHVGTSTKKFEFNHLNSRHSISSLSIHEEDANDEQHFPVVEYLQFAQAPKLDSIVKKLKDYNDYISKEKRVLSSEIDNIGSLLDKEKALQTDVELVISILGWSCDVSESSPPFNPFLDVLRLCFVNPKKDSIANQLLSISENANRFMDSVVNCLKNNSRPLNQMLAMKLATNIFSVGEHGENLMYQRKEAILQEINSAVPSTNTGLQLAVTSLFLNYTIFCTRRFFLNRDMENAGQNDAISTLDKYMQQQCIAYCYMLVVAITDQEAKYRVLVALGNLMDASTSNIKEANMLGMESILRKAQEYVEKDHKIYIIINAILRKLK